jgi:hypothetical protein
MESEIPHILNEMADELTTKENEYGFAFS